MSQGVANMAWNRLKSSKLRAIILSWGSSGVSNQHPSFSEASSTIRDISTALGFKVSLLAKIRRSTIGRRKIYRI